MIHQMLGYAIGWPAAMLSLLKNSANLSTEECSWIGSFHILSRFFSPVLATLLMDRVGRSPVLELCALALFLMWIILLVSETVVAHLMARLMFGIAIGVSQAISPVYLGEISSPRLRGNFMGMLNIASYVGQLAVYILAAYLPYDTVHLVIAGIAALTMLGSLFLKEPAQFLLLKGKTEQARSNFFWLKGSKLRCEETEKYFQEMSHNVLEEKSKMAASFRQLLQSPYIVKSLRINSVIPVVFTFTGYPAINTFVGFVLTDSVSYFTINQMIIVIGVLQLMSAFASSYITEMLDRRLLLCLYSAAQAIVHAVTAALFVLRDFYHIEIAYFNWLIFACVTGFFCLVSMVGMPVCTIIRGELLPQSVKGIGSAVSVCVSSVSGFLCVKIFLLLGENYGMAFNFVVLSIGSVVMFLYVYIDLIETRGKTLTQIQEDLKTSMDVAQDAA